MKFISENSLRFFLLLVISAFIGCSQPVAAQEDVETKLPGEMRTWKDASGKFEVEAQLIGRTEQSVKLKKADGLVIEVPAEKLSEADQEYLQGLTPDESDENPFAGGKPDTGDQKMAGKTVTSEADLRTIKPDPLGAKLIPIAGGRWSGTFDAALEHTIENKSVPFPISQTSVHDRRTGFAIVPAGTRALLSITNAFEKQARIVIIDIEKREASFETLLPFKEGKVIGISPSGNYYATMKDRSGASGGRIDFWQIEQQDVKHVVGWETASFQDRNGFYPNDLVFIDDDRLLTLGSQVVMWDWQAGKPLYAAPVEASVSPGLSANRKQLAVYADGAVAIINLEDGSSLGAITADRAGLTSLAVSEDGTLVAGLCGLDLRIWDLAKGEIIREMTLPGSVQTTKSLYWAGGKYLLVGDQHLVDVELRVVAWSYGKDFQTTALVPAGNSQFWYIGGSHSGSRVVSVSLPHFDPETRTSGLDPDELLVLKPGTRVSVKLELPFPPDDQKKVLDHFKETLSQSGMVFDERAAIVVKCYVEKGKENTINLRQIGRPRFGGGGGSEEIHYTPSTSIVEIVEGEQQLWRRVGHNGPAGMIRIQDGETSKQAVDRLCQPSPGFFQSIQLPRFLAVLPGQKESLGSSKLTEAGVQ
jgi:hypothetical protein